MDELWWIRAGQLATAGRSEMAAEAFITASGQLSSAPTPNQQALTGACGDAPALGPLLAHGGLMRSNDVRAAKATEAV
jgi:hypothetical protein